jgi:hypothetical protein
MEGSVRLRRIPVRIVSDHCPASVGLLSGIDRKHCPPCPECALSDRLSEKISVLMERTPASGITIEQVSGEIRAGAMDRLATLTPEQRAAVRSMIRESLPDEMREKLADRLAERLEMLTPEQRNAVRAAIKERLAVEVRDGLSDRVVDRLPGALGNN